MFPGLIPKRPDKAEALKQLKVHATFFGAWILAIRVTPYVLQYVQKEDLELSL